MKVTLRDAKALAAVRPLEFAAYLRANGWQEQPSAPVGAMVWLFRDENEEEYEILLPLDLRFKDYPNRVSEGLKVLEIVEKRSQLEILSDLMIVSADVIRIRAEHPGSANGRIPLEEGLRFVSAARDLLLAAACSAVDAKPYFPNRKPKEALDYLAHVELGQTEHASYVLTMVSPVTPKLILTDAGTQLDLEFPEPFERKVTALLARALIAIQNATQRASAAGDVEMTELAVHNGVSADLCEAVERLCAVSPLSGIEIGFTWSRTRPPRPDAPRRIMLSPETAPFVTELSRIYRKINPQGDSELNAVSWSSLSEQQKRMLAYQTEMERIHSARVGPAKEL